MSLVTLLDPAPKSASRARLFARKSLDFLEDSTSVDAAVLIASELVTNAIIHGGEQDVLLEVEVAGEEIRIEVWDSSKSQPSLKDANRDAESGRGLKIVDALSSHWGVHPQGIGKSVFAYIEMQENEKALIKSRAFEDGK